MINDIQIFAILIAAFGASLMALKLGKALYI